MKLPFELLDDARELARYAGWTEEVYRDLQALQAGALSAAAFDDKYLQTRAVLVLDLTGFTETAIRGGALHSFLRILDAHRVCIPVAREYGANFIRTFADDLVALFETANSALDAALEIHRRTELFAARPEADDVARCKIGVSFGPIYRIGPNRAMGDTMNRASKLGEDTARGGETLVTEDAKRALASRTDVRFVEQSSDDLLFRYYRIELA